MASLRASGTDEEYEEREQLLQDIHDMVDAANPRKQSSKDEKAKNLERRESNGEQIRDAAMTTMKKRTSDFVDEDDFGLLNPNKKQARVGSNRMTETASVVSTLVDMLAKANEVKADEAQAQHKSNELAQQKLELEEKRYRIVGDGITVNATRKRFDDLMTAFHEITMAALRASGTEEEYEEREQLLQDIHDLNERRETNGEMIRDAAMSTMKRKMIEADEVDWSEEATRNKKQSRSSSQRLTEAGVVVASLVEMMSKANEKKLELEERRYELDKAEREARFALDRRGREAQLEFFQGTLEVLKSLAAKQ
ncbi:hypothetical protein H310_10257 [Aphanomyces invadans]|uniref:Uncharacterized protein n=1 Tax=Aphanomyces invadans TaxID=157072 RepID=A0A024TSD5_9STRA|nr:hypothetical protein H310_10257 [Aphanomyces invadans]ETV96546.1 hypothetical protein H310_10257 [Aphanomyces invadans]|eukprot:XP_008874809.1 hypothetical protein H310_10257 [Aphanomyces invadans]